MHLFGGTQDGVHGTGLDAERAPDAQLLIDPGHLGLDDLITVFGIQGLGIHPQQFRQGIDSRLAPGRTLIDIGLTAGDGLGVGAAAGKAAAAALGLGEDAVNLVDNGRTLDLETDRGETQQQTEYRQPTGGRSARGDPGCVAADGSQPALPVGGVDGAVDALQDVLSCGGEEDAKVDRAERLAALDCA